MKTGLNLDPSPAAEGRDEWQIMLDDVLAQWGTPALLLHVGEAMQRAARAFGKSFNDSMTDAALEMDKHQRGASSALARQDGLMLAQEAVGVTDKYLPPGINQRRRMYERLAELAAERLAALGEDPQTEAAKPAEPAAPTPKARGTGDIGELARRTFGAGSPRRRGKAKQRSRR